jgi:hypothetical protein
LVDGTPLFSANPVTSSSPHFLLIFSL